MTSKYSEELEFAVETAKEAGKIAAEMSEGREGESLKIQTKSDKSLVTLADKEVNKFIIERIHEKFPEDAIVAEEGYPKTELEDGSVPQRCWYVDPIDGTAEFVTNNGEWAVMIGLACDGVAEVGVVYQADRDFDVLYYGTRSESFKIVKGGSPSKLECVKEKRTDGLVPILSRTHPDVNVDAIVELLGANKSLAFNHGSLGLKAAKIAEQAADVYLTLQGGASLWDYAAPEPILVGAGGVVRDVDGNNLEYRYYTKPSLCRVSKKMFCCANVYMEDVVATTKKFYDGKSN